MDDADILQQYKNTLLSGNNLKDSINKMIKVKSLPAACQSITTIAGSDERTEIVINLSIEVLDASEIADVNLYITEDLFDPDGFTHIDNEIYVSNRKITVNNCIKLRALRVVFDLIKTVSNNRLSTINIDAPIYVRTLRNGICEYRN